MSDLITTFVFRKITHYNMKSIPTQLETASKEAFGDLAFVEPTLDRGEFQVYTECWSVDADALHRFLSTSKATLQSIAIDGGKIMLTITQ